MKLMQRRWPNLDAAFKGARLLTDEFDGRVATVIRENSAPYEIVVWFEVPDNQDTDILDARIGGM